MARLFYTGFETGTTEWNGVHNSIPTEVVSDIKRTGTYSLRCRNIFGGATPGFRQVFSENQTELYGRMALYLDAVASVNSWNLLSFRDENNAEQFFLAYDAGTATLSWYMGSTIVGSAGNVLIPATTWVVLEFYAKVDGAAGQLTLKVNGSTDATYSGDTTSTASAVVRSMYFQCSLRGALNGNHNIYLDDIAINNTEGSYQNSYAGLGGVFYLYPTADGAQNDWAPSTGTANYAMVDDIPPDNATTFNQALDSGDIDLYEVDDCPEYIASINCLQVAYRAALVTSGYNELTDLVRVGTVNYSGLEYTIVPITPSFTYYLGTIHYLNPGSGSAWGTVEVNALQAGIEITT